jgi:hypothetical protein
MKSLKRCGLGAGPLVGAILVLTIDASDARAGMTIQRVPRREVVTTSGGVSIPHPTPVQIGSEFRQGGEEGDVAGSDADQPNASTSGSGGTSRHRKRGTNRTLWHRRHPNPAPLAVPTVAGTVVVQGQPNVNHFTQRFGSSDGNNAFSLEPPDQGLCVGGPYVMEIVNVVRQVYTKAGAPVGAAQSLNDLYGYAPEIDRSIPAGQPGRFGPTLSDPSCLYDAKNQRWIISILTLETDSTTGDFAGPNHIDLAVSQTPDPAGPYNIYSVNAEDNGTFGQPDHQCTDGTAPDFCLGDYPHIGLDANGLYITTNEFFLFADGFTSAQLYAISRADLAAGASALDVVHIDQLEAAGFPGFTVWPANSNEGDYDDSHGGVAYFLSSTAVFQDATGIDNKIAVWSLKHTKSLGSSQPRLDLTTDVLPSQAYAVPPLSQQKAGSTPLADCLNDVDCAPTVLGTADPFTPEVEGPLDSNDSRFQQVWFVDGALVASLDTAVVVNGAEQAGIAWFAVDTRGDHNVVADQGYLAASGNNLTYPAIATLPDGRGVMAFTLVGNDYYPSAGYADLNVFRRRGGRGLRAGVGAIRLSSRGVGPEDGLTEYQVFNTDADGNPLPIRPRWGDYGAATTDGATLWIASEYIGQTCDLATFVETGFTCGNTRTALGNWDTRVTQIAP